LIFYGPPGTGKTTLARVLALETGRPFDAINAVSSGVKDIRDLIEKARKSSLFEYQAKPLVFIDEIHRFNKSQQDGLLAAVEQGLFTLIGATTENPSFEVNSALLSRCQVLTLQPLSTQELNEVLQRALLEDAWLQERKVELLQAEALIQAGGGDARRMLNALEMAVNYAFDGEKARIDGAVLAAALQDPRWRYDKSGEMHYDVVSAFIKSLRGSDVQAALYWLARMLHGGEKPEFIARRMLILASEDIGMANPNALLLAQACLDSVKAIGMPESRIVLSQVAVYLAKSAKSNAAYLAIDRALDFVRQTGDLPVPLHLRNAPTDWMKKEGYGKGYLYPHDFPGATVPQQYGPDGLELPPFFEG
jgi:putative ATPase